MKAPLTLLSRASLILSSICLIAMTAIISYQVVARYFFNASPAWSERLSLVLLAYLVFFGAAAGVHLRFHIRIDAVRNAMPARFGRLIDIAANLAVAGAGLVMVIAGWQLTTKLWAFDIPALGLPSGLTMLPLPIAGALIVVFALAHVFDPDPSDSEKVD